METNHGAHKRLCSRWRQLVPDALKMTQIGLNAADDPANLFLKDTSVLIITLRCLTCVTDVLTSPLIKMSGLTELLLLFRLA